MTAPNAIDIITPEFTNVDNDQLAFASIKREIGDAPTIPYGGINPTTMAAIGFLMGDDQHVVLRRSQARYEGVDVSKPSEELLIADNPIASGKLVAPEILMATDGQTKVVIDNTPDAIYSDDNDLWGQAFAARA